MAASYINIDFTSDLFQYKLQWIPGNSCFTSCNWEQNLAGFNTCSDFLPFPQMTRLCDISYIFTTFISISQITRRTTEKYFIPTAHGTSSLSLSPGIWEIGRSHVEFVSVLQFLLPGSWVARAEGRNLLLRFLLSQKYWKSVGNPCSKYFFFSKKKVEYVLEHNLPTVKRIYSRIPSWNVKRKGKKAK